VTGCRAHIVRNKREQRSDELRVRYSEKEHAKKNKRHCPFETFFIGHARIITLVNT